MQNIPATAQDVYVDSFTLDTSLAYRAQLEAEMIHDLQHAEDPATLEDALEQIEELRSSLIEYMIEKCQMFEALDKIQQRLHGKTQGTA